MEKEKAQAVEQQAKVSDGNAEALGVQLGATSAAALGCPLSGQVGAGPTWQRVVVGHIPVCSKYRDYILNYIVVLGRARLGGWLGLDLGEGNEIHDEIQSLIYSGHVLCFYILAHEFV